MSDREGSAARDGGRPEAIAAYKAILKDIIDRRPSGTRHRLAQALGKARSFISQISNPAYGVAIPAQHLSVIFEICHFSSAERRKFLEAYAQAHPRKPVPLETLPRHRTLHLLVPDLDDPERNAELDRLIHDLVEGLAKVARSAARRR
jgi:hypothetical protein